MEEGEVVSIIGSSGSGKTTLLRCINFLEKADKGQILLDGEVLYDGDHIKKMKVEEIRKKTAQLRLGVSGFQPVPSVQCYRQCYAGTEASCERKT